MFLRTISQLQHQRDIPFGLSGSFRPSGSNRWLLLIDIPFFSLLSPFMPFVDKEEHLLSTERWLSVSYLPFECPFWWPFLCCPFLDRFGNCDNSLAIISDSCCVKWLIATFWMAIVGRLDRPPPNLASTAIIPFPEKNAMINSTNSYVFVMGSDMSAIIWQIVGCVWSNVQDALDNF